MSVFRKTFKAYVFCVVLFILLSFVLAALICFTGFSQKWAFGGLIADLSISCFFLGCMEGRIFGKKGLLVGLLSSVLLVLLILCSSGAVFGTVFTPHSLQVFHLIPLAAGTVGGVIGANR